MSVKWLLCWCIDLAITKLATNALNQLYGLTQVLLSILSKNRDYQFCAHTIFDTYSCVRLVVCEDVGVLCVKLGTCGILKFSITKNAIFCTFIK